MKSKFKINNRNTILPLSIRDNLIDWNKCNHNWKRIESQDLSEIYGSVRCEKCGCPGEMTWKTQEVFWPAT